ncbi:hypothetical protein BURKHO8Y_10346 [Burkholderia sp. 8Y]|nr:hypothetical protein BURKHO8Y_10346 [Burkholderia sp. 8Y]
MRRQRIYQAEWPRDNPLAVFSAVGGLELPKTDFEVLNAKYGHTGGAFVVLPAAEAGTASPA